MRVENTLGYNIFFIWAPCQSTVGSSFYLASPKSYQLGSTQTKSFILRGGSAAPLSNDQLTDALDIYAYRLDDLTGERRFLRVNDERVHMISLSRDDSSRTINVKITEPRGKKNFFSELFPVSFVCQKRQKPKHQSGFNNFIVS